jgi:hypothetical protein
LRRRSPRLGVRDMHVIPWLTELEELSGFEKTFLVLGVFVLSFATGFVIDAIMKNLAFGPPLNGILALGGVCAGIYLRYRWLSPYRADDLYLTTGFALGTVFLLFLALGFVKSRL